MTVAQVLAEFRLGRFLIFVVFIVFIVFIVVVLLGSIALVIPRLWPAFALRRRL